MKILKEIRFYLVLVSLAFITLLVQYYNQKDELLKCKTGNGYISGGDIEKAQLIQQVDSLREEIYVKDLNLGSLELMWSILEEVNKPLADSIDLQVE